ncbi:MAG: zinc ribbon domain-containing protein [Defluviitaleaceae bacterium]|nr:zinc ribbon domain-containing protein [Defluviitaleaceae bacterium]
MSTKSSQVSTLRLQFYQMGTPQKRQFIERLRPQVISTRNAEYKALLDECVRAYNAEVAQANASPPKPASSAARPQPRVSQLRAGQNRIFCSGCGVQLERTARFCSSCGFQANAAVANEDPRYPSYTYHDVGDASFIGLFRKHFSGGLYLTAIVLVTAGMILGNLMSGVFGLLVLLPAVPALISYWIMFSAAKSPDTQTKAPGALTVFQVYYIIEFVIVCLLGLALAFLAVLTLAGGAVLGELGLNAGGFALGGVAIVLLVFAGGLIAFFAVQLRAALQVIASLKKGLATNLKTPLHGVTTYAVMGYIAYGIIILSSLAGVLATDAAMSMMPAPLGSPVSSAVLLLSTVLSLTSAVGGILFRTVFLILNNALKIP